MMQSQRATEQRQDSRLQESRTQESRTQDSRTQESSTQDSKRQTSQQQNSRHQHANLDTHYRKIGISAVAAAVRCKGQPRRASVTRYAYCESD
jgi:hypothetical protein